MPLVLNGVSFEINPKEKIGVVGRTGSGKSSLILSLIRLVELDTSSSEESKIEIDGIDISKIGLRYARTAMTLIPQDPFLL